VERTAQPKTKAHLAARAGGSSRRSEEANLATSLAGSRGRRMVHRRMSSRERRMVLLRMSRLASSARFHQRDAMMRPLAAGRGLWRGCGISNLVAYCWSLRTVLQPLNLTLDLEHAHVSGYSTVMQGIRKRAERRSRLSPSDAIGDTVNLASPCGAPIFHDWPF